MQQENLFQVFSQVFIESQQSFNKCDVELRAKCRNLSEKLGKFVDEFQVEYSSLSANIDNNTSDAYLVLDSTSGDKFGRIREGDTATANFKVLANGTISGGTAVSATVTVSLLN